MKISVIGTGHVGATLAYTLLIEDSADELVLVNRTHERAIGEAADLDHALAFLDSSTRVRAGTITDTADSDITVLTLSVPAGQPDRRLLAAGNGPIFRDLIPLLADLSPRAILLVVTNPVEPLTQYAIELSGFEPRRVIGTGTLIDSARLRSALSKHLRIHPDDVRAYVIGEHGQAQFPVLSSASTGGIRLGPEDIPNQLVDEAIQSSHDVFLKKGHTSYAIAQATAMIIRSIVHDQLRTLPVTTLVEDYMGVDPVCLSIPCVVGRAGIVRQLRPNLDEGEAAQFRECAAAVRRTLAELRSAVGQNSGRNVEA